MLLFCQHFLLQALVNVLIETSKIRQFMIYNWVFGINDDNLTIIQSKTFSMLGRRRRRKKSFYCVYISYIVGVINLECVDAS